MEKPDRWIIVKIGDDLYKVLAAWYGGYLGENRWKLNSGIVEVIEYEHWYDFIGQSGNAYRCLKNEYGTSGLSQGVLEQMIKAGEEKNIVITVVPEDTDWLNLLTKD